MSDSILMNTIRVHFTKDKSTEEILGQLYDSSSIHYLVGPVEEPLLCEVLEFVQGSSLVVAYTNLDEDIDIGVLLNVIKETLPNYNILVDDEDTLGIVQHMLLPSTMEELLKSDIIEGILFPEDEDEG